MGDIRTQREGVLNYMKQNGSITSQDAFKRFAATRLSSIIHRLRHVYGYEIVTEKETGLTRYGNTTTYARYILKEDMKHE